MNETESGEHVRRVGEYTRILAGTYYFINFS